MSAISQQAMSGKWRMMPRREAVTFKHQTAVGVYTSYAVSDAWWRDLNDKEKAASRGAYVEHERNWFLPLELLTADVAIGDLIVDADANTYTVLTLSAAGGLGVGKYKTVNLVLAAELRDSVTISRPLNVQDGSLNRVPTYVATYSGIAGKVQEITGDRQEMQGKVGFHKRYAVYLGQRVTVTTEDRVTVSGVTYQIMGYVNPDRIDELMALDVERLP